MDAICGSGMAARAGAVERAHALLAEMQIPAGKNITVLGRG
jgi:hypothetical protein